MKKKLALLLSALMVVTAIPATAFAVTTNTVSKVVSGTVDSTTSANAPVFSIEDKSLEDIKDTPETIAFKATLNNAEWDTSASALNATIGGSAVTITGSSATVNGSAGKNNVSITLLSSTQAIIEVANFQADDAEGAYIKFPIMAELTDEGEATMDIDPMDTVITGGTYKFANVVEGAATVAIDDTVSIKEGTTPIETITIDEVTAGSLENGDLKLKLSGDFEWKTAPTAKVYPSGITLAPGVIAGETVTYAVTGAPSTKTTTITLVGGEISADFDDVEVGEICEVTVSGVGVDKTTLEVGTATDYSVSLTAENKTVPTFYSGRVDEEADSLKVTIKENIANSWITGRKSVLSFPEGVKVLGVDVTKAENASGLDMTVENNEVKFDFSGVSVDPDKKIKLEMEFQFSISPKFTGDIVATLSGAGIGEDQEVVVGTVEAPVTVTAETNKVSIDYRNVAIGDIIIKEAYAGALQKDKTLSLKLNTISFDGDPTVEVVEGDIKIDEVEVNGGQIDISIDSESAKTPATLKVTNIELFLDRSLPAGNYSLKLVANSMYSDNENSDGDANTLEDGVSVGTSVTADINTSDMIDNKAVGDTFFQNSSTANLAVSKTVLFDVQSVTVMDNYVEVVTAGRDQDDSTFTTQIKVTIGANTMIVGDEEKALDVPAYISNGYTMMPVRAVTEALSGAAIVRWDDATKTVTITFGARVISMTVGSSSMLINGVPVQMQAAVEITGSRAFIPLRDLGYALGLNDSKIGWDDATKTATLN